MHRNTFFLVDGSLCRDHPILIRRCAHGTFQRIDFGTGGNQQRVAFIQAKTEGP